MHAVKDEITGRISVPSPRTITVRVSVFVVLVIAAGCGVDSRETRPGTAFILEVPKTLTLPNGEQKTVEVAIQWQRGEPEVVEPTLTVEPPDKGVTARIAGSEKQKLRLIVLVSETAPPNDYQLTLNAKASNEAKAKAVITVKVPRKE